MPEELNSEEEIKTGESSEEELKTSTETTETSEAETTESTPDQETIDLIKSVREEVGEKRFNGLINNWNRDRQELLKYREKESKTSQETSKGAEGDDALIDYLDKKLDEKRVARERAVQEAVKSEVDEVRKAFPQFTEQQLLETANDLSAEGRPASIMTAAIHLDKVEKALQTKGNLTAEEIQKKKAAGTLAGRSGYQANQSGLKPYNPEKDKGKSIGELWDDAKEELGM